MEIQLMNTITGFEAGLTHLQDPSFFSRLLRPSQSFKFYSFWTCVALLLATIATFSSILHRSMIALLFRFKSVESSISEPLTLFDTDSDDESSSFSSDSENEETPLIFETDRFFGEEDFRVSGLNKLESYSGKDRKLKQLQGFCGVVEEEEEEDDWFSGGVVKLWNDWGFGFDKSSGLVSMLDLNRGEILTSLLGTKGQIPAITMPSPAVVVSAGVENMRSAAMRIWDARSGGRAAAAIAEWQPRRRRVVGVDSGGVEKLYVREHGGSVVVRDLRNVGSPLELEEATESDGQMWFDADAVLMGDGEGFEFDGELTEKGGGVVTRCYDGCGGSCSRAGHSKSCSRTRFYM
ncbi:hypothetical protein AAC387_Pa07g2534 [Persea americana]